MKHGIIIIFDNLSKIISIQYEKIGKSFFEKTNNELYYSANLDLLTKKNKELTDKINGLTQQQQSIDYYIDSINQIRNTQSNKRKHNATAY